MRRGRFVLGIVVALFTFFSLKSIERYRYINFKKGNYDCTTGFRDLHSDQKTVK